ncbi:phage tail assembly protein [Pseudogulbenkiania sp. NH8B]|uniref:tail assembly protein n=1 Tax=Pseudogulbenkiania sp. (strain NH8B) TaxID=748280 RepID=UPI0002279A9D|nr:tail assembly protein [Pseudogulbenkiania sp. NH8B]BAK75823.1 phage tail assembly protein [Pseudogulbenkiania sp. NH8B]
MTAVRTIRLGGALAEQFGAEHRLAVDHVGEAAVALNVLYPGFNNAIRALDEQGVVFRVTVADRDVSENELTLVSTGDILIMPVIAGASGVVQTVVGAVLIVVGAYFGQGWMVQVGIGMVMGGIVGMMTPIPKIDGGSAESGNSKSSYLFGGTQNTGAQGMPVPVGCGVRRYTGIIVSAGISVEDV